MPANLPPQYFEIEKKYREAKIPQEKLVYLQEMLAIIPKHKGTEKIQAELKTKISKLKDVMEKSKKGGGASTAWYQVDKQGAGQIVLVGLPNCGKSSLLNYLTNANVEVGDYPFTTLSPQVGMMNFEDIKIQIVDTPPLTDSGQPWLYAIYRFADIVLIIIDAAEKEAIGQFEMIKQQLNERNIIFDNSSLNNIKAIILLSKIDIPGAKENIRPFMDRYTNQFSIIPVSIKTGENIESLKKEIFKNLNIIRVYTKKVGQPSVKKDPIVLKIGSTVLEAAEHIHKDFKHKLRFTRLWNDSEYSGQRVEKNYVLKDGDIVEFHV